MQFGELEVGTRFVTEISSSIYMKIGADSREAQSMPDGGILYHQRNAVIIEVHMAGIHPGGLVLFPAERKIFTSR